MKTTLRSMFASKLLVTSLFASRLEGKKLQGVIHNFESSWSKCVTPLVKVFRLVNGDVKPTMVYSYEVMDRTEEQIANNFNGTKRIANRQTR